MNQTMDALTMGKQIAQQEAVGFQRQDERVSFARMFCASTVESLWRNVFGCENTLWPLPKLFVPVTGLPKGSKHSAMAAAMGDAASALALDTAAYLIATLYTSLLPERQRSEWGAHCTPPHLVRRLLDMAARAGVDWRTCSVCDPACGGGAFLASVGKRIVQQNSHVPARILLRALSQRLRGWDIDPFAAWLSQVFLEMSVMDVCRKAGERLPILVEVTDSLLRQDVQAGFDLVIGHPPCGPVSLLQEVRYRYRRSLDGHADLYGLFTDLAIRLTRRGGVIGYVTPTSLLAGQSFKSLRGLLAIEARPVNIDFVSDREMLLAIYKSGSKNSVASVHQIAADDQGIAVVAAGRFEFPSLAGDAWRIPRPSALSWKLQATVR